MRDRERREATDGVITKGKSWEKGVTLYWGEWDTKTTISFYGSQAVPARPSESNKNKNLGRWFEYGLRNLDLLFNVKKRNLER